MAKSTQTTAHKAGQTHVAINVEMWVAMAIITIAALLGAALWLVQGDSLFATLVQQGLAWCL